MSDLTVKWKPEGNEILSKRTPSVGRLLRELAGKKSGSVRAPSDHSISYKGGIGPRGAFAQVIMTGPRAVYIEFGGRGRPAQAPLRSAVLGRRG